jgi:hypothetical protein
MGHGLLNASFRVLIKLLLPFAEVLTEMKTAKEPCPYCRMPYVGVEIHGHIQCEHCGVAVTPCCGGGSECSTEKSEKV